MGQRTVRVVVGQGDPDRHGLLRTVLEDDGFDVVGEAATTSPLARLLTDERPDVVVLDDAIGVSAVELTAEIVPSAKIIVVWPAAVVPIAGAIRVDPSEILQNLAATVALAAGIGGPGIDRPEWIERVRKDPATLRELLAARGGVPTRPSVTELQRRGHRLHPSPGSPRRTARKAKPTGKTADDDRRAVVTPIGLATPLAAAAAMRSSNESWNRRLGIIALGGAAVAGALMIALAFSNRAPSFTAAGPFIPPIVQPTQVPPPPDGGGHQQGGDHTPSGGGGGGANGGSQGGRTTTGGSGTGTDVRGGLGGPLTPPSGGGQSGGGGGGTGSFGGNPGGPRTNNHLPGVNGNGKGGGSASSATPGQSGSQNPHGGPPGWDHRPDHAAHGAHAGGQSAAHGRGHSNAGGNSSHAGGSHADKHSHKQ